jgi:hypothetical protein
MRKSHFGQISRSNSLNRTTIRLIRSKNLTHNDFPSLRLPKSDRLLVPIIAIQSAGLNKLYRLRAVIVQQSGWLRHSF